MIPRKFTGEMLKGRKATLERDIRNVAGVAIGKGATVTITEVVRGKGLTIKTEKCPHSHIADNIHTSQEYRERI